MDSAKADSGDAADDVRARAGRRWRMIRFWLGLALLGGSWLFGLNYYHQADYLTFSILIIAGSLLMWGALGRLPNTAESIIAIFLLIPVVVLAPAPYKAIPILLIAG